MHFALYDFGASGEIAVGQLSWTEKFDLKKLTEYTREDEHVVSWLDKKSRDSGKKYIAKVLSVSENKAELEEVAKLIEEEKLKVRNLPLAIVEPSVILAELGSKRQRIPKKPYVGDTSDTNNDTSGDESCCSTDVGVAPVASSQKRRPKKKKSPVALKKFAAAHSLSIMKDIITSENLALKETSDVEECAPKPLKKSQMVSNPLKETGVVSNPLKKIQMASNPLKVTQMDVPNTQRPCCCNSSAEVLDLKNALTSLQNTVKELLIPHIKQLATGLSNLEKSLLPQAIQQLKHQAAVIPSSSRSMPVTHRKLAIEGDIDDEMTTAPAVDNGVSGTVCSESNAPVETEINFESLNKEAVVPSFEEQTNQERPSSPLFKQLKFEMVAAHAVSSKASRFVAELMEGVFTDSYLQSHCLRGTKNTTGCSSEERRAPMRTEYISHIKRLTQEKIKPMPTDKEVMDAVRVKFNNCRRKQK